jgi:hypothetical protein
MYSADSCTLGQNEKKSEEPVNLRLKKGSFFSFYSGKCFNDDGITYISIFVELISLKDKNRKKKLRRKKPTCSRMGGRIESIWVG